MRAPALTPLSVLSQHRPAYHAHISYLASGPDTPKHETKYLTARFTYDQNISKKKKNQCFTSQRELAQTLGCEEVESALLWLYLRGGESYGLFREHMKMGVGGGNKE